MDIIDILILIAVAAVAVLLPKFAGEPPVPSSASPSPIVETPSLNGSAATPNPDDDIAPEAIHVTTPGDLGETVFMDIQVGPDGQCTVDMDMIKAQFPEVMFFSGSGSPLGNDIDDYLMDSYHMAVLVSNGTRQPGYDRNHVSAQNFCAILLYDDQAHLYGYAIGLPKDRGGGVCRLEFTRCDYDFSSLVQEQAGAYSDSVETLEQMRHVSPGEIYDCGAAWYIRGFNTTKDSGRDRVCQMYHLWSCLNSPYLERHCRNMKYFQPPQENANDLRYTYYLLLDEDYDLIGYTLLSSEDAAPTESDAPQATSRYVTAPGDKETVYIDLELGTNGECRITLAELQAQFPQAEYMEFNGVPRMGLSIDDYLLDSFQMAFLVGSHGQSGGDDDAGSFSPTTDPDSTRALLLFDSKTHLMGHAIGVPEEMGDGTWRLYLTLCDYDFAPLLEEQMTAYYASEQMSYIPPEEIDSCGADWFLYAYHMRADREMLGHCQMYHLWSQLNSPYLERHCREIETLESRRPRGDAQNPRYVYYLLLDQDHELIGYTMLTSGSSTAPPAV